MRRRRRKYKDARLHQEEISRRHARALRNAEETAGRQFEIGSIEWRAVVDRITKDLAGH
jgi:hypothetical protein